MLLNYTDWPPGFLSSSKNITLLHTVILSAAIYFVYWAYIYGIGNIAYPRWQLSTLLSNSKVYDFACSTNKSLISKAQFCFSPQNLSRRQIPRPHLLASKSSSLTLKRQQANEDGTLQKIILTMSSNRELWRNLINLIDESHSNSQWKRTCSARTEPSWRTA